MRDFAFMPLDVARLRDSDLASNESPEACWAAVLLWAASWHQVPAASIPNDDKWLAQQTGYGRIVKEWMKVRAGALRGWIECTDGRLYHPVVVEKALDAWDAKRKQRWKTECARIKKHNDRHETSHPIPSYEEWVSLGCPAGHPLFVPRDNPTCPDHVPSKTSSKGEGEGQRQGDTAKAVGSSGSESADARPTPGDVCKAMKAAGMASVNPSSPKLVNAINAGLTLAELGQAAMDSVAIGKGFAYAIAMAEGRRADAAAAPKARAAPQGESFRERDARIGRERWEQMTGETHPDNQPKASGMVIDSASKVLEISQ